MNDLEQRLAATRALLPDAPPVPEAVLASVHNHLPAVGSRRFGALRRRRRIGGALAFALVASIGGLAAAGLIPHGLPSATQNSLNVSQATTVGTVQDGTQEVVIAPGRGAHVGQWCMSLANAMGSTDVSPVVCQPPERVDDPGFGHAVRPDNADGWMVHVRIPDPTDVTSAIITEAPIPERGGVVTLDSGGRTITQTFPDTAGFDARAERDLSAWEAKIRRQARTQLESSRVQHLLPTIPAVDRAALELRVIHGASYAQIAEREGISVDQVRSRLSRAISALDIDLGGMLP